MLNWLGMFTDPLAARIRAEKVEFDEIGVTRRRCDGQVEAVRWDELREVVVVTTDEGPFVEDVYWLLIGPAADTKSGTTGCAIPGERVTPELLTRFQALPGFDNRKLIEAMASTGNASFLCWRAPDGT